MRKILWLLALGALSASSIAQDRTLYEETIYNKPDIRVESEVYLGDRMLVQQVGEWKECITPSKSYSKRSMGWEYLYKSGEPICKRELKDKYYWPTYLNSVGHNNDMTSKVRWKGKKGKYTLCQVQSGFAGGCIKKLSEDAVKSGETFIYSENSFQQTIAYEGKSGEILKFNYAEFSGGFAREAFSREFQIDLNEGSIAAYKGAIIEVIEANNMQIKYKVIRNFSSDR
mgnify:FL=1|jgi:hypothetical protein|tara:strand:+ start:766 stop:1449 length:684 start_codon:yes stop_codon:yes gene_type:complete